MKVFSAIVLDKPAAFQEAVEREFPNNNLKLADNAWLIAGSGTSQEICAKLGMPTTPGGKSPMSAVVTGVSGYYGYGGNNIWEWIAAKQTAAADA